MVILQKKFHRLFPDMLSCGQCRSYGSSIGPACRSALCRGGNGLAGPYCLHGIGCNRSCLIQSGMSIIVHDGFPFKSNSYANIVHTRHSFAFLSLVLYIPKSALFN